MRSRRLMLLGLGLSLWACRAPSGDMAAREQLRVLTLNLLTFAVDANVDARTAMVIDFIDETEPDVIALQEAAESAEVPNRAAAIAEAIGYSYVWTATEVDAEAAYHGGPALLSRWPIEEQSIADLPHLDFNDEVQRRAIFAKLRMPFGDLAMVATHTTTNSDAQIKNDQSIAGAELLIARRNELPGIYAGDFNAEPSSLAMRTLRGEDLPSLLPQRFRDAWMEARPSDAGFTYPSRTPSQRLDYIYSLPGTRQEVRALSCQTRLETPIDNTYASDHLALLCDFAIE